MNSLDLSKDPEIVPSETIEAYEVTEVKKQTEATEAINQTEKAEVVNQTDTTEELNQTKIPEVIEQTETPEVIHQTENDEVVIQTEVKEDVIQTKASEDVSDTEAIKETVVQENEGSEGEINVQESTLETAASTQPHLTKPSRPDFANCTKPELIEALKLAITKEVDAAKDEVENIKQLFYKKSKQEIEDQKKQYIEAGGLEEEFIVAKDELEEAFKALLNQFRGKKASFMAQLEMEKESNLLQKQQLLEQMKLLVESSDDVSTHINEFRALQQKWKTIGPVPQTASTDIWKQFNLFQESFWDLIKINNELREYDFKKNLESKTFLCEAAEKLAEDQDILSAFQQLQKLHEEWHELGPVAREIREQIWNRFKEASTAINKKHQTYYDVIRKQEEENYELKTALIEKIESFDFSNLSSYRGWDEATKSYLAWQDEWRKIGFAPRKINQKIYDRYRKACDKFFLAKGEFFRETKNILNQNSDKKKELCEKAEALKDSVEWKETTDKLIQLQKEWKTVGPVAKKYSDELWKRFIAACDFFFEQKNKNTSGEKNAETENMAKKKELIAKINSLEKTDKPAESQTALRTLMSEWNLIGHVPFKEKDKIYKEYREAVDKQFEVLNIDSSNKRMDSFRTNLKETSGKNENKLFRDREKLMHAFDHLKSEIATYENNIGFFTSSSKKGGGLIQEMERKIESLKEESKEIEEKIKMIEETIE